MAARLIAIVGPTASGKSALALDLALRHGGEIVSCDSLQVFRGLDVGSAKPTPEERARVPHHLLDVVDPDHGFSAADYARLAREAVAAIAQRGRLPVVAGGSGLYLRALLHGLFDGPSRDPALRERLEGMAARHGDARLFRLLTRRDPEAALRIEPRDRVRVVRALEILIRTGLPQSRHFESGAEPLPGFEVVVFGLAPPRDELRRRVEARTADMFSGGLLDEVRGLLTRYPRRPRPLGAIGYREAVSVVDGRLEEQEARHAIVASTMRYAKRQMTWFRHQETVQWFASAPLLTRAAAAWLEGAPA